MAQSALKMSILCHVFSALAGSFWLFESKPNGQLPSVPQPCGRGRTSFPCQQAQQSILCSLCVPCCPFMSTWREQPLHRGQFYYLEIYTFIAKDTIVLFMMRMFFSQRHSTQGNSIDLMIHICQTYI